MAVANIMPGDRVEVQLIYSEMLTPEQGIYQFVYPAVVGPRYSNIPESVAASENVSMGQEPLISTRARIRLRALIDSRQRVHRRAACRPAIRPRTNADRLGIPGSGPRVAGQRRRAIATSFWTTG